MNNSQNKIKRIIQLCGIALSSLTLAVFFVIGCLWFARPEESELENRRLTAFPEFTWESFISGEYTSQISLWFSDTFPTREGMIGANDKIHQLYGIFSDERAESGGDADEIDTGKPMDKIDVDGEVDIELDANEGAGGDVIEGYYCVGDTAYELYYFNKKNSEAYVQLVAKTQSKLRGKVNVYDMIVPLSYEFHLGSDVASGLGASDCSDAIDYMYSGFDGSGVKTVDICSNMMKHRDEYLYFRADHHWTARGAYYAYEAFCKTARIEATPLDSYQRLQFNGFLGTLYNHTKNENLKSNPDYVEAFVPMGTNTIKVTERNGKTSNFSIVNKATDSYYSAAGSKYNCFIAGDNPISEIHNPNKSDGSTIVVVKESFGNALVPFLVDSYEYVYVIDYRYFKQDLCEFALDKGADDILFINNVIATSAGARLNELKGIIGD